MSHVNTNTKARLLVPLILSRFGIVGLLILALGYCALGGLGGPLSFRTLTNTATVDANAVVRGEAASALIVRCCPD